MCSEIVAAALFLLSLSSCGENKENFRIITKTIALSNGQVNCPACIENSPACCVMRLDNKQYLRVLTFEFDSVKAKRVFDYKIAPPMGAIIFEHSNMPDEYEPYYQLKMQRVVWVSNKMLIDGNDTIREFKHLSKERALIADSKLYSDLLMKEGNVVIYTY